MKVFFEMLIVRSFVRSMDGWSDYIVIKISVIPDIVKHKSLTSSCTHMSIPYTTRRPGRCNGSSRYGCRLAPWISPFSAF
jgi:hypothetical protein